MRRILFVSLAYGLLFVGVGNSMAEQVLTNPATEPGDPALQFDFFKLTADGSTIIATAKFDSFTSGDQVWSLPVPANPSTDVVTATQLSTGDFLLPDYDVDFAPVISPDEQTILFSHNGTAGVDNTIYTMPIGGEFAATSFTGLFGADPNQVSPGVANFDPVYSPNGSTIFFINSNSGFVNSGGTVPDFDNPADPGSWSATPGWDQLYSVPAAGGTPVAVTQPSDGDLDANLFVVTPDGSSIVFAPDNPVTQRSSRGDIRPKIFTIPATGGATTEVAIPEPAHEFTVSDHLAVTPDGANVVFIADYETIGKKELFSVPLAGGTPTRISDDLPFAGDVTNFVISPDGTQVAYAAGQNTSASNELFLTPITGGTGNSIRVSDPAPAANGVFDVSTSSSKGVIAFDESGESTRIFYLGDLTTDGVNDLYIVDTTEKTGITPDAFTFVGSSGGDFFDEANWQDTLGNNPAADTINPGEPIRQSLVIDGDTVGSSGGEVDFQLGGSLELTAGSVLELLNAGDILDFNIDAGLKITDATIRVDDDIVLEGTNALSGGLIESIADDIEFQDEHDSFISGTTFRAGDNIVFENSAQSVTGATFEAADRFALRFQSQVTLTDTDININSGLGDVDEVFAGNDGEGSLLTLKGTSTLLANRIDDSIDLVLEDSAVVTLTGTEFGTSIVDTDGTSFITVMSTDAEIVLLNTATFDARDKIVNGFTGDSYLEDPTAWNVTDWNGLSALPSLKLLATTPLVGDYNDDGVVDAADYTVWRSSLGSSTILPNDATPGVVDNSDYIAWRTNYGQTSAASSAAVVPEPATLAGLMMALMLAATRRRRLAYATNPKGV